MLVGAALKAAPAVGSALKVLVSLKKFFSHRNLFTFGNKMSLMHQYVLESTAINNKYVFKTLLWRIFKTKIHGIHDTELHLKDGLEMDAELSDTGWESGTVCLHSCYCQQKPGHNNQQNTRLATSRVKLGLA